ncbi:Nrap protein [Novymonas esmeraldas]|uniref:Nrap protein n=1 Tax=Novymonas esmeraldas TaxID=1808958 RepID=A0AAW0EUY7_9TRYP
MALRHYNLTWSDALIDRVETHLRDIHGALLRYYAGCGYPVEVEGCHTATAAATTASTATEAGGDGGEAGAARAAAPRMDVVSPAGSFLLRTCVYDTPFSDLHAERGVGADLVLSIPPERCSVTDLQEGRYLERRHEFLEEVRAHLTQLAREAAAQASSITAGDAVEDGGAARKTRRSRSTSTAAARRSAEETDAAARLSRMEVCVAPIHGCHALGEKTILQLRFRRRDRHQRNDGTTTAAATAAGGGGAAAYETVYVNLHCRPSVFSARASNAVAARKHPYYVQSILEDYLIPHYLAKLHEVCVASASVRRAIVVLKCWAHHTGLMSAASGHPEALNGFTVAAMVLRLLEEGVVTAGMSLDNMVRAVWVQLSRGFFLGTPTTTGGAVARPAKVSVAEETGQVAVLRFAGELHNILWRTSSEFFVKVVGPAADEALQHPVAMEVVDRVAFQPLPLRFDVALTVRLHTLTGDTSAADRAPEVIRRSGLWRAPRVEATQRVLEVLREALGVRCSYVAAWQTDADRLQVVAQLQTEAEGRQRLTRGPPIEDASAVERFNAFWGAGLTSTRQFSDGAIYRCVLWTFPEDHGTHTTVALSPSTVLRRVVETALRLHVAPEASVSVLLGGLEGYLAERVGAEWRDAAPLMQRSLLEATQAVQHMLQNLPRGSVPCRIVAFDVIAASERHTEVFPVRPHLALTYTTDDLDDASYAGLCTAPTIEPIHCVLSIDDNHKIPDTMEAIAMMKGAIAAQLAKTLQAHYGARRDSLGGGGGGAASPKRRKKTPNGDGSGGSVRSPIRTQCTSHSFDIIYRGYLFRVYIAHYREISLLRALQRDAEADVLEMKLYWTAQHAKFLRTIAFGHHSYSHAVRLAKRWMGAMCLYEFISPEAVELLVANAYLQPAPHTPKTPAGGFLRFVQLLATHDWSTPLVLPFTDDDSDKTAVAAAALVRKLGEQQGMFIATPYAPAASPFTVLTPRPMIVSRLVQLAQSVVAVLLRHLEGHDDDATAGEVAAFTCDPSAFDFHVCFHPRLMLQPDRALRIGREPAGTSAAAVNASEADPLAMEAAATAAHAVQRIWQLDELDADTNGAEYLHQLVEREPAAHAVRLVRAALREQGMMFYDALAPWSLHGITIDARRRGAKSVLLHRAIRQVARGAFLGPTADAFVPVISSTHDSASEHSETDTDSSGGDDAAAATATAAATVAHGMPASSKRRDGSGATHKQAATRQHANKRTRSSSSSGGGPAKRAEATTAKPLKKAKKVATASKSKRASPA